MMSGGHEEKLREGVESWNQWRKEDAPITITTAPGLWTLPDPTA